MRNTSMVPPAPPSPERLGERLAQRDETALEDVYAAYGAAVQSYVARFVGPHDAEDVVQRTFLDVWRSADRYDPSQRFTGWLFTIAHRRAVDTLRSRKDAVIDVDSLRQLTGDDGRETAQQYADAADVRWALAQVPEHEREVLVLAYYDGLTQPEIAARLDVPLGTVKARAARGTRRLATIMRASQRAERSES